MKICRPIGARFVALAFAQMGLGMIVVLALSRVAQPASGTWTNAGSGGIWSGTGNWSGGTIATGTDAIANFSTLNISADNTVHLDSARTTGSLLFGDTTPSNNWILDNSGNAANILTLDVTAGSPGITVNNQTATISAVLAGSDGLAKSGAGTLVLGGTNTVTGGVTINAGTLQLNSTGALTAAGNISIATTSGNSGSLTLTGASSSATQSGASTLTVGNSGTGTAALNIGTTSNGATFTTGTGLLTINKTGTVNVGSGAVTGTLNTNGDVTVNSGMLTSTALSTFNLAAGKTMTVTGGGKASFSGGFVTNFSDICNITGAGSQLLVSSQLNIAAGTQVSVLAGGSLSAGSSVMGIVGNGTLLVDGAGSTATVTGTTSWGSNGFTTNVTISNGAVGNFSTLLVVSSAGGGGPTTVALDVLSGASVNVSNVLSLGGFGPGNSATVNVQGSGSALVQSGTSSINVGGLAGVGTAVINIGTTTSGAEFFTSTGTMTIRPTGTVTIGSGVNTGTLWANGDVTIDGGTLARGSSGSAFNLASGKTMSVTNGGLASFSGNYITASSAIYNITGAGSQLETLSGSLTINSGAQVNVTAGGEVAVNNPLSIGTSGSGTLSVDGASSAVVASLATWGASGNTANVSFSNLAGGTFTTTTVANSVVANTTAVVDVKSGADVMVGALSLAASGGATTSAALTISDPGSTVTLSPGSILTIGHVSTGTAVINALAGGALAVGSGGSTNLNARGTLNIDGGIVDLKTLNDNGGTINFYAGSLSFLGNLTIGTGGLLGDGDLTLGSHDQLILSGATTVDTSRSLTLDGGTLSTAALTVNGAFIFNSGTLTITQSGASINYPIVSNTLNATINVGANNVSLGSAASLTGFIHQGTLNVGANTVTLNSAGYSRLGILTTLNGGTINAPNGIYVLGGGNLIGNGAVTARITGDSGSVIEANGALALGDAVSPAGFNFDGELRTKQFAVTLSSSAQAGLGNLTILGSGASPGTLNATNGYAVDLAEALTGFGTVNSTNTLAKRAIINGAVQGNSGAFPITLSGYIKGLGTFNNVTFTGTFDPGLSPTLTTVGSITFASTSTLIMELGGTAPGSGHDQIDASGTLALDGTLLVSLVNGFGPSSGNSFDLFDWATINGTFDNLSLPALGAGLAWDVSQLHTAGVLSVVAGLVGDYNNNGTVDAADYVVWRKNNGTTTSLPNDPIGGTIGQAQYDNWRAHFGQPPGGGAKTLTSAVVPEPATLLLMTLAAIGCGFRRARYVWRISLVSLAADEADGEH